MPKKSAGLLMYRMRRGELQVLLVHPGGPLWTKKDAGAWFIPKGEIERDENEIDAAKREFAEETGIVPTGELIPLGSVKRKSGKVIHAWGFAGDCDLAKIRSNTFAMEWPPRSGRMQEFPEIDRAAFFNVTEARAKAHPDDFAFVERLAAARSDRQSSRGS